MTGHTHNGISSNSVAICTGMIILSGLAGSQPVAAYPALSAPFLNATAHSLLNTDGLQVRSRQAGLSRQMAVKLKPADQKRLDSALIEAIVTSKTERAYDLLWRGANPNARDKYGRTPLMLALDSDVPSIASDHSANMVSELLSMGARVDVKDNKGNTPLLLAIKNLSSRNVKEILAKNPPVNVAGNEGVTPLMAAAARCDLELCRDLLARGANVNAASQRGYTPLSFCIVAPQTVNLILMMKKDNGLKAEIMKLLLSKGANIHYRNPAGYTMLMLAALYGEPDTLSFLIDKGADVNELGEEGISALTFAVMGGKLKSVKLLLSRGADANLATDNGETPLMLAADKAHYAIVEQLLHAGARVNAASLDGSTPLIFAQRKNHTATANQLIAAGAGRPEPVSTEKVTLRFHFKAKDTVRHRDYMLITVGDRGVRGSSGSISEIKELRPNGDVVIHTVNEPTVFSNGTKEVERIAKSSSTTTHDNMGKMISYESDDKDKSLPEALSKISTLLSDAILPQNAVSQNESWITEFDSPTIPGSKLKVTGTYLGIEKIDGADTWKIRQTCSSPLDAKGNTLSMDTIYWLRVDNGWYARIRGVIQGMPSPNGSATMTLSVYTVK